MYSACTCRAIGMFTYKYAKDGDFDCGPKYFPSVYSDSEI